MKTSRLLYLSAHHMAPYLWRSGELISEGLFAATEIGHQKFADYLQKNQKSTFSILANVSEEGFHTETIPFLRGSDRQALIDRKLGQFFFTAELTASLSLGYEKSKRKNERLLLAALTSNAFFAPWLQAINRTGAALAGIYSVPLLTPTLLKKLHIADDQCLLLTVQDQSIRQSYFEKGDLHFSRLTPLQNSSISGIAQTFSVETLKLQQYLASQRLIGRNQTITAHVLAHPGAFKAIQSSCVSTANINFNVINIEDVARRTGLKTAPPDTHCEQIFLNLLATTPSIIQFANDDQRHGYHIRQLRSGFYSLGTAALLGCALISGKFLFETYSVSAESSTLRSEASQARARYNEIVKSFPSIPTNNETLKRLIDRYVELEKAHVAPDGLFREVSRAMEAVPTAELESVEWQIGGVEKEAAPQPPATNQITAARAVPPDSEGALIVGTLKAGSESSVRQMLGAFNVFVETLKTNPKLEVNVLQRPFDIEPGKSLKGDEITLEERRPRTFSLQIIRKLEP